MMLQGMNCPNRIATSRHARLGHQQQLGRRSLLAPVARDSVASTAEPLQQHVVSSSLQEQPLEGKIARFSANKQQVKQITEAQRPLADYMALPASQYSVLDARKVRPGCNNCYDIYQCAIGMQTCCMHDWLQHLSPWSVRHAVATEHVLTALLA
jgi:hypothetical protein